MTNFHDLPYDILPFIIACIHKPIHLATSCLVNKDFHAFSVPALYHRVAIYSWHRHGKIKVIKLFTTLSAHPHIAKYVHRLEIRDFPKVFTPDGAFILSTVLLGLKNCVNLRACTWTRDGSLNSDILRTLAAHSPQLHTLEINGHSTGNFDPHILLMFSNLRKISLIMPSLDLVQLLPTWIAQTGGTLTSLTLICKSSNFVTDAILASISSHLTHLQQLHITGCPRVTHNGIWAVLSAHNTSSSLCIRNLSLEGVSMHIPAFVNLCSRSSLPFLESLTLTPEHTLTAPLSIFTAELPQLLSIVPRLRSFQIYSAGSIVHSTFSIGSLSDSLTHDLVRSITQSQVSNTLVRFSIQRMSLGAHAIGEICQSCPELTQLEVFMDSEAAVHTLPPHLRLALKLRSLHINYQLLQDDDVEFQPDPGSEEEKLQTVAGATAFVGQSENPEKTLVQFGCNTCVWQVLRMVHLHPDGTMSTTASLSAYEYHDIPEQFLVVRT